MTCILSFRPTTIDQLLSTMSPIRQLTASPWAVGLWSGVLGAALWSAPAAMAARVHAVVWDGLRPGLIAAGWCTDRVVEWQRSHREKERQALEERVAELQSALSTEQTRARRLTAQMLMLRDRPAAGLATSASVETANRLYHPAILEADVLGETLSQMWRQGVVLDRGGAHGLRESALVLQSTRPLIDRGQRDQLSAEDMLLLGQAVLGKIETVGRWSSTFLPITDPDYRGRAQLVRDGDDGPRWGATGLLRGDGAMCRLDGVVGNESVRPGDLVMTADRDAALGTALCYGTVAEAHLGIDDREWRIVVEPLPRPEILGRVQILRAALNPARLWEP
jgi:cell shape-determining protein MreC